MRPSTNALGITHQNESAGGKQVDEQLHAVGKHRGQCLHAFDRRSVGKFVEEFDQLGVVGGQCPRAPAHFVREEQLTARRGPEAVWCDLE
ncbi:unannotated protein [freshwater metagenome]|uniref:Unannotated protein n=1 Tax=freshwater metagenome TaxID=449393 RepID=A0A6J7BWZ3_9ZZZZ